MPGWCGSGYTFVVIIVVIRSLWYVYYCGGAEVNAVVDRGWYEVV